MTALPLAVRRRFRPDGRPDLKVVAPPRTRHVVLFTLFYLVLAGATVFGAVSLNALAAGDAVAARTLEGQVVDAERTYGLLVAEVARLEDPDRVRRAATKLGMIPGDAPRYVLVHRSLPADGAAREEIVDPGETTDPMKPVLSADR